MKANGKNQVVPDLESTPPRVLVVDDEDSVRITTAAILEQEGYTVDTAEDGHEALSQIERRDYDLVLTDLRMQGMDGGALLTELNTKYPDIVTVVLTGYASIESSIEALRQGAYDYLVKPCIIEDLKHTVRRGVEHRRLMLAEQRARTNLEQLNRELEQRVAERTAELTHLNEELAEANRAKDVFLATLSHELRTPLTPVLGWVTLMRTGGLSAKEMAQALDTIERNARLQARLIDDLLDISRIISGKLHLEYEPVDLNTIAETAVETVRSLAEAAQVKLDVSLPDAPLIVQGSPVRLQQIVWNFLSNAIKFTPAGGRVSLRLERADDEARLIVQDTGIGIPPEFLPHVFDRFRQADGSTTRQHGGLGLGLAIVDALAKLHHGQVRAESAGVGHGARFTFTIPLANCLIHTPEVEAYAEPLTITQPILVVEDSPDTLEMMQTFLRRKGCRVLAAESGTDALKLVAAEKPGVVVTDIGMPEMDGYQLLSSLRRTPGMEKVPAIALSGYAMSEDRDQALRAGFAAHIAKPVDPEELLTVIQKLVKDSP